MQRILPVLSFVAWCVLSFETLSFFILVSGARNSVAMHNNSARRLSGADKTRFAMMM
jgi:hypothetical protein